MSDNFKTDTLDSLCELIVDCPHSTPTWTTFGYVVIRNQNITDGVLDLSSPSYTDYSGYRDRTKRASPQENDIVITREAPMGRVCLIPKEPICCLGQRQVLLRADRNKISAEYLYWSLRSPFVQRQILINEGTGATVSNMRIPVLKALEIPRLASIEIENKKAKDLSNIQNKIQLNTQINQTLEQIAQALFKSWFVDFDPVRAKVQALSDGLSLEQAELAAMQAISGKTPEELTVLSQTQPEHYAELAETAKAFPCEMVEVSNSIYIPKGWKIKYFNEIIDTYIDNRGKTPPIEKQGIPLLEVKHLPKNSVFPDLNTTKYISNDTYENWLRNKPEALDIMLSTVGTVGRVNLVPTNNKIAIAQNILGFRFNLEKATQIYMFYLMKSEKFIFDMEARVVETVQKSIKRKDLEKIPLLIPTLELQNLFSKFVIPFVIKQNNSENTNLEKIRNDLLPKLLSGEIQL